MEVTLIKTLIKFLLFMMLLFVSNYATKNNENVQIKVVIDIDATTVHEMTPDNSIDVILDNQEIMIENVTEYGVFGTTINSRLLQNKTIHLMDCNGNCLPCYYFKLDCIRIGMTNNLKY